MAGKARAGESWKKTRGGVGTADVFILSRLTQQPQHNLIQPPGISRRSLASTRVAHAQNYKRAQLLHNH